MHKILSFDPVQPCPKAITRKKEIPFIIPVIPASTPRYCCANPQGLHNGRVLARTVQPTAHPSSSLTSQLAGFSSTLTNREAQREKISIFPRTASSRGDFHFPFDDGSKITLNVEEGRSSWQGGKKKQIKMRKNKYQQASRDTHKENG